MNPNVLQLRARLVTARSSGQLVRVHRSVEPGWTNGYVLGVGADWAALCLVSDGIQYDGFDVFRLRDAAEVESPAPHHAFIERALELRSDPRPESPSLELSDTASMIRSAGAAFPIVTIHTEENDPEVCHIGAVEGIDEYGFELRPMTPDATWDEERMRFEHVDVTRVSFGGLYERALVLCADDPV